MSTNSHEVNGKKVKVVQRQNKEFKPKIISKLDKKKELIEKAKQEAIALNSILQKCTSFEDQVDKLVDFLKLPENEVDTRHKIANELDTLFKKTFPQTKVSIIGSTQNGLACIGSDMDLTLLFEEYPSLNEHKQLKTAKLVKHQSINESDEKIDFDMENTEDTRDTEEYEVKEQNNNIYYSSNVFEEKCKEILNLELDEQIIIITKLLQRQTTSDLQDIRNVKNTRCPVSKFIYEPAKLNCELSLNNFLAVYNTELIRLYLNLEPQLFKLIYVIRYWAKQKDLHGQMKFNSYTLIWLVIFYLQQTKRLPSVDYLSELKGETKLIHGWNVSFENDTKRINFEKNEPLGLTILLKGFFEFYASFAFDVCVLSVRKGGIENITSTLISKCSHINLQDPFDLAHNLSVNISEKTLGKFKSECSKSFELLKHCLTPKKNSNKCWGLSILLTKKTLELSCNNKNATLNDTSSLMAKIKLQSPLSSDLKEVKFIANLLKNGLLFDSLSENDSTPSKIKRKRAPVLNQICDKVDVMGINNSSPKRLRVDNEKFLPILNTENIENEDISNQQQYQSYLAKVTKNTWLGRRNIKRELQKQKTDTDFFTFERMVSERVLLNHDEKLDFTFNMAFLINTHQENEQENCLRIKFDLLGESYSHQDLLNFSTLVHFLDVYLNNSIDKLNSV